MKTYTNYELETIARNHKCPAVRQLAKYELNLRK